MKDDTNIQTSTDATPNTVTEDAVIAALCKVYDPEIPVNIYELGLIYHIDIDDKQHVHIQMTLTTPGCPVAQTFPGVIANEVRTTVPGVSDVSVEVVWDPPWTQDRMTEAAKLQLGML